MVSSPLSLQGRRENAIGNRVRVLGPEVIPSCNANPVLSERSTTMHYEMDLAEYHGWDWYGSYLSGRQNGSSP